MSGQYAVEADERWVHRAGGLSAILFGVAYIVIIALYIPMGAPPSGVEERLTYIAGNRTAWWAILGLSVLTDFLLAPVALSLYLALKGINKNAMLMATAFVGLFVLLDLAITWTNYASLIILSDSYTTVTDEIQRTAIVTAATAPALILESSLLFIYNSLTLAIGILLTGLVMLKGVFSKGMAYLGIATGVLGIVAVVGSMFVSALGTVIILASILTTIWVLFAGFRLYRLRLSRNLSPCASVKGLGRALVEMLRFAQHDIIKSKPKRKNNHGRYSDHTFGVMGRNNVDLPFRRRIANLQRRHSDTIHEGATRQVYTAHVAVDSGFDGAPHRDGCPVCDIAVSCQPLGKHHHGWILFSL